MGEKTLISWTDHTFNPVIGCSQVSPGCANCYAQALARLRGWPADWTPGGRRMRTSAANWKTPLKWDREAAKAGVRRRVFCASLSDWAEDHPIVNDLRDELFALIALTPNLDWLMLTKRVKESGRYLGALFTPGAIDNAKCEMMAKMPDKGRDRDAYLGEEGSGYFEHGYLDNVWIGATVENQKLADQRIPELLKIPARVRFLSVEPMLSAIIIPREILCKLDWVIIGGESGPGRRELNIDWMRDLSDQCLAAGVPVFIKQDSGPQPGMQGRIPADLWALKQFPKGASK